MKIRSEIYFNTKPTRKILLVKLNKRGNMMSLKVSVREERIEQELRKQKEAYTKQRLDAIKEHERDLLDTKS